MNARQRVKTESSEDIDSLSESSKSLSSEEPISPVNKGPVKMNYVPDNIFDSSM